MRALGSKNPIIFCPHNFKITQETTVGPRIARIRIVRIHYSAILFLVQKYSNSVIPRNSVITKTEMEKGIQIV